MEVQEAIQQGEALQAKRRAKAHLESLVHQLLPRADEHVLEELVKDIGADDNSRAKVQELSLEELHQLLRTTLPP